MTLADFLGAKIPLYAFNRGNKSAGECKEPPVAFLDSLIIGEVCISYGLIRYLPQLFSS